jgi:hypothetical protein
MRRNSIKRKFSESELKRKDYINRLVIVKIRKIVLSCATNKLLKIENNLSLKLKINMKECKTDFLRDRYQCLLIKKSPDKRK